MVAVVDPVQQVAQAEMSRVDIKGRRKQSLIIVNNRIAYRIKLDSSSEIEGSPSSTELVTSSSNNNTPPATANMKTQAAFVNKLYK